MRTVLFLVCLCSLLLKGYQYVYTGIHHYSVGYYAAQHGDKRNLVRQAGANHDVSQFRELGLASGEDLVYEDIEDENEDSHGYITRKAWWSMRGNAPPAQLAALNYLNSYSSNLLPFCSQLPDIYLTQRALRI